MQNIKLPVATSEIAVSSEILDEEKRALKDSDIPSLFGIVSKLTDWVHSYWQFYITFSTVMVGWLITVKPHLSTKEKIAISLVYLAGSVINLRSLIRTYIFLDKALLELAFSAHQVNFHNEQLSKLLDKAAKKSTWKISVLTHILCAGIVLYLIAKLV